MKYILLVSILILISGCATKYKEPIGSEYSTISIPHNKVRYNFGFSGEKYLIGIVDKNGCVHSWHTIEEKEKEKEYETVKIVANENIAIRSLLYVGNSQCNIFGSFEPEMNKHYTLSTKMIGNNCYMYVSKNEDNQEIFIKMKMLKEKNSITSKMCLE